MPTSKPIQPCEDGRRQMACANSNSRPLDNKALTQNHASFIASVNANTVPSTAWSSVSARLMPKKPCMARSRNAVTLSTVTWYTTRVSARPSPFKPPESIQKLDASNASQHTNVAAYGSAKRSPPRQCAYKD